MGRKQTTKHRTIDELAVKAALHTNPDGAAQIERSMRRRYGNKRSKLILKQMRETLRICTP
jgi:hypothetical protein